MCDCDCHDLMQKYKPLFQETSKFDLHIAKLLQLMWDFVPQPPFRGFAPGLHWGTSVPRPPDTTSHTGLHHRYQPDVKTLSLQLVVYDKSKYWSFSFAEGLSGWTDS